MALLAIPFSDLPPNRLVWLWPGWLAQGTLHVLAGDSGAGKSTITANLAAAISSGGCMPDGKSKTKPSQVLIYSSEDDPDLIRRRLEIAGGDLSAVHLIQGRRIDPAQNLERLREMLLTLRPALVILDPLTRFSRSQSGNAVRSALEDLAEMARESGSAILGILHFSKGSTKRPPGERLWGSYAYKAVPRMVMLGRRSAQSEEMVLVRVKSNISPVGGGVEYRIAQLEAEPDSVSPTRVDWGEVVEGTPDDILESGKIVIAERPLQAAMTYLLQLLARGPLPANDVYDFAKGLGHTHRTVERAKGELGIVSFYVDRTSHWRLPETPPQSPLAQPRQILH